MKAAQIRSRFLEFFGERGHAVAPSSSLVPADDPTLLFTTAGMVQFKPYFAWTVTPPHLRVATVQKCLRAGGKGSDLENVGRTIRHNTFFEMLGNFAFGDYFKKEAIRWAWEFVTEVVRLPGEALWASIYLDDEEAFDCWHRDVGLPADRIVRLGKKDNFWGPAGDSGACGPCTEIYIDLGPAFAVEGPDRRPCQNPRCQPGCDCERYLEFWNLVFNQFYQEPDGTERPLPKTGIDTGMGLERLAFIIQRGHGVDSLFDIDHLAPLRREAWSEAGRPGTPPSGGAAGADRHAAAALNVVADHVRALTFAIADGAVPANEGRGYVLRRILRRAVRFAKVLGLERPFMYRLVPTVVGLYGEAYPELHEKREHATVTVKSEEDRFHETLRQGMDRLYEMIGEEAARRGAAPGGAPPPPFPGRQAFVLYDTFGFPPDLTWEIAQEKGFGRDEEGFAAEMGRQKAQSRAASAFGEGGGGPSVPEDLAREYPGVFVGYDPDAGRQVLAAEAVMRTVEGPDGEGRVKFLLSRTPFYPEGGGQVADRGRVSSDDLEIAVEDAHRIGGPGSGVVVHLGRVVRGAQAVGAAAREAVRVRAEVDRAHRIRTARHHTVTHLVHAALRRNLGTHVRQAGSLVAPDRMRFDFTHPTAVGHDVQAALESEVNDVIMSNLKLSTTEMGFKEAIAAGALAFFGEKYGERVRVVRVGAPEDPYSVELCGGTHVGATGEIGLMCIVGESSVAAGTRRVEVVCGTEVHGHLRAMAAELERAATTLKAPALGIAHKIETLLERERELTRRLKQLEQKVAGGGAQGGRPAVRDADGVSYIAHDAGEVGVEALRAAADRLLEGLPSGVVVLGARQGPRVLLVAKVSADLTTRGFAAGEIIKPIAGVVGGSGGGRKEMAQAGGSLPEKLDEALAGVGDVIRGILGRSQDRGRP